MIAHKNFAGVTEFLITVGVSAVAAMLTFLFGILLFSVLQLGS